MITSGVLPQVWSTPSPFWFSPCEVSHSLAWNYPSRLDCLACEPRGLALPPLCWDSNCQLLCLALLVFCVVLFFGNVGSGDCSQVKEGFLPTEPSPSQPFFFLLDVYFPALTLFKADISFYVIFLKQKGRFLFVFSIK